MITARTYTVGFQGRARRLDDLTGAWIDISPSAILPGFSTRFSLLDVMTDPNDKDKVFAVGFGEAGTPYFGIYVSTDGGTSWYVPGGNYQTNISPIGDIRWNEVWVIDSQNIVVAGHNGYIAISNDGGANFNLSTALPLLPTFEGGPLEIPNCWSIHFLTPLVGVVGTDAHVLKTVDGGNTWSVLNGGVVIGYPFNTAYRNTGIHISADQQTIVALSQSWINRSTDGGLTWTGVHQFALRNGTHLTWINDNEMWAYGADAQRLQSIDAGATWSILSAYTPGGPVHYAAHFYQNQNGFFGANRDVNTTSDGSLTGSLSEIFPGEQFFAVWTWFSDATCYQLTDCDNEIAPLLVANDLSASVGQIIRVCPEDLPPSGPGVGAGTPIEINPDDQGITEYGLVDCCGNRPRITILNDLGAYLDHVVIIPSLGASTCWRVEKQTIGGEPQGLVDLTGGVFFNDCEACLAASPCSPVPVLTECKCFLISEAAGCDGAIELLNVGQIYPTCEACNPSICYYIVNCEDPEEFLIVSNDFAQYLNKVIKLEDCPEKCWNVLLSPDCNNSVCVPDVIASFDSCELCLPPVPEPEPLSLHTRAVKPGYYTPGCPPAYTEKVNCNFAAQFYQSMVSERYGINFCCAQDLVKWKIKKSLLDLNAIYNPELCKCTLQTCCPPECVDATLQVFNPRTCLPPSGVTATLEWPTDCLPPSNVVPILTVPVIPVCTCYYIHQSTGTSTIVYRLCGFDGIFSVTTLLKGQELYACADTFPAVLSGTPPLIQPLPNKDCATGQCVPG